MHSMQKGKTEDNLTATELREVDKSGVFRGCADSRLGFTDSIPTITRLQWGEGGRKVVEWTVRGRGRGGGGDGGVSGEKRRRRR